MGYVLGIDLGTTFSAAAVVRDGVAKVCTLGARSPVLPSVVFLRDDGELLIGEAAERRGVTAPDRVGREFKRRMGDPTPILLGGTPFSAHGLTARLLRSVVDQVHASEGGPPDRIVVTRPANWGEYKQELFAQVLHQADVEALTVTEPEAAAVHGATSGSIERGGVIAVYDLGGGTFDATVLRSTGEGFELLGTPFGIEHLGGVDFDDAVFRFVVDSLGHAVRELDPSDPVALGALARLRRDCVEAKEALSSDSEVTITVALPTAQRELRLGRAQFEDMIRPVLLDTVGMLDRTLRSAEVEPASLSAVLLVGGSSRIPLVRELLTEQLGVPIRVDLHPKHAVALGAARLAEVATASTPRPAGTSSTGPRRDGTPVIATTATAPGGERAGNGRPRRPGRALVAAALVAFVAIGAVAVVLALTSDREAATEAPPIPLSPSAADTDAIPRPLGEPLPDETIVFTHEEAGRWNLWLVNQDGTGLRALTREQAVLRSALPAISPDRRTIAYTQSDTERVFELYLRDTSGQQKVLAARDLAVDARATWSPDATKLAYVSQKPDGRRDLVVLDLRTGEVRPLTDSAEEEGDPAWSPDGSRIAYWVGDDLFAVPSAGGEPTRLTSTEGQEADPAWSPDGTRLAYAAKRPGGSWDIAVLDLETREVTRLSPGAATDAGDEADPAWSPDGTRLAFETKRDAAATNPATDDAEIYVVDADGANPVRLTRLGGFDAHPAWGTGVTTQAPGGLGRSATPTSGAS